MANNIDNLTRLKKVLTSDKLARSGLAADDIWLILHNMKNANQAAPPLGAFIKGLDELIEAGTKFDNLGRAMTDLLKEGTNFPQGIGWTLTHITQNSSEFAGKILKFENPIKTASGNRIIDLVVQEGDNLIFYEFKSVKNIPPGNFAAQFLKDLSNDRISDLSQIKWIFDNRKLEGIDELADFKEPIMNTIDKMLENGKITDDMARRILRNEDATSSLLVDVIEKQFDNIFKTE